GRAPLGDRLVLEVAQDVAVLAVELADTAQRGETLHGLGDELVRDHALAALLVGHEQLERRDAEPERLGDAVEDVGLVVQDEVEAEVEDGARLGLLAEPHERLRQRLALVVDDEGHERGQPGPRRSDGRRRPVVVLGPHVQVAVDEPGQDVLARGVDHARGRRQERLGPDRHDRVALDGDGRLEDVRGGDDLAAADDDVDAGGHHGRGCREAATLRGWRAVGTARLRPAKTLYDANVRAWRLAESARETQRHEAPGTELRLGKPATVPIRWGIARRAP